VPPADARHAGSRRRRRLYRLPRHLLVANPLLPLLIFVLLYCLPFDTPPAWTRQRRSVHLTNLALAATFGTLIVLCGWQQVLLIHPPIMAVASIAGVWLFSVQHVSRRCAGTAKGDWSFTDAALQGLMVRPTARLLHWLTDVEKAAV
jgi:omega-6 fatty acid desaturase (delta-12 desaturase)